MAMEKIVEDPGVPVLDSSEKFAERATDAALLHSLKPSDVASFGFLQGGRLVEFCERFLAEVDVPKLGKLVQSGFQNQQFTLF
jgi:hypothetical protein